MHDLISLGSKMLARVRTGVRFRRESLPILSFYKWGSWAQSGCHLPEVISLSGARTWTRILVSREIELTDLLTLDRLPGWLFTCSLTQVQVTYALTTGTTCKRLLIWNKQVWENESVKSDWKGASVFKFFSLLNLAA